MSLFAIMCPLFILMFCLIGMVVGTVITSQRSVDDFAGIKSGAHPDLSPANNYFHPGRTVSQAASGNSDSVVINLRRLTAETLRPIIQTLVLGPVSEVNMVEYSLVTRAISGGLFLPGIVTRCLVPVVYLLMHRNEAADEEFAEVAYA